MLLANTLTAVSILWIGVQNVTKNWIFGWIVQNNNIRGNQEQVKKHVDCEDIEINLV